MTFTFRPADEPPGPADLQQARRERELLRSELPRVREAALAWRNGLAALLAGLIGFGLVKGRSDISDLTSGWAAAVGVLLLTALVAGAAAAMWLMTAAHGLPKVFSLSNGPPISDHGEAVLGARRLFRGIVATAVCTVALVAAVGATWYGAAADGPGIHVTFPNGAVFCGSALTASRGGIGLTTDHGVITLPSESIVTARAGTPCP